MRPSRQERETSPQPRPFIRSPQDLAAGLLLFAIAAAGLVGSWDLSLGESAGLGPGMLPRVVAALIAAFGILLVVQGLFASEGSPLTRWSGRGLAFVLGAALLFAWTIRPLGLIIAAPLAMIFASLADPKTRPIEIVVFSVAMTAFCIGLFSFALRLPIPVLPSSIPYPLSLLF